MHGQGHKMGERKKKKKRIPARCGVQPTGYLPKEISKFSGTLELKCDIVQSRPLCSVGSKQKNEQKLIEHKFAILWH
jgi:hypothetical protein